jgi:maltose/moltooligosaccharide transporter
MLSYALKNTVCFGFSTLIGRLCDLTSKKAVHTFGLLCMAGGLIGMFMEPTPTVVMIMMGLFGIGWATTLSIPFALLSEHIPSGQEGVLMGAFNIFIAAPQVLSGIAVGAVIHNAGDNYGVAMLIGGAAMLVAALMLQWVHEREKEIPVHAH